VVNPVGLQVADAGADRRRDAAAGQEEDAHQRQVADALERLAGDRLQERDRLALGERGGGILLDAGGLDGPNPTFVSPGAK
jgi:hypothetical protein